MGKKIKKKFKGLLFFNKILEIKENRLDGEKIKKKFKGLLFFNKILKFLSNTYL